MTHCPRCGKENVDPVYPHTCTPLALKLADRLRPDAPTILRIDAEHAGEELRRLHTENEELKKELAMEQRLSFRKQLHANADRDEALLRQALHMMEESHYAVADVAPHNDVMEHFAVIEALRERLGVSE